MSDESELADAIQKAATMPKVVQVGDERIEMPNPKDLIEVKKFNQGTAAAARGIGGIQTFKINRPGSVQ